MNRHNFVLLLPLFYHRYPLIYADLYPLISHRSELSFHVLAQERTLCRATVNVWFSFQRSVTTHCL